jgi:hypothetical protein
LYGYVLNSAKITLASFTLPEAPEGVQDDGETCAKIEVEGPAVDAEGTGTIRGANKRPVDIESFEGSKLNIGEVDSEVAIEATANLAKWWGQPIPFRSLVSSGALVKKADGTWVCFYHRCSLVR